MTTTSPDGAATSADKAVEIHDRFMREDDISFADMEWLYGEITALRARVAELEARPAGIGREYDREPFTIEE